MNSKQVLYLFGVICQASLAWGVEPIAEFSQGLRRQGDLELTLDYLQRLESRTELTSEQLGTILLERGLTQLQVARGSSDTPGREHFSGAARESLTQFLKQHSQHPRRSQGQAVLGNLLLHETSEIAHEDGPSDAADDQRLAQRQLMQESKSYLVQARDYYEELWGQYPTFIPEEEESLRASKRALEEVLIRAQLDLAQCTFCEAMTYPRQSEDAQRLLAQAGLDFQAIHQRYRSQTGGLYARFWQARCFQEQANALGIRISLGIYSEILDHHGDSLLLQDLRDRALRQRLTCLNSEHRRDFQLVIQESRDWLDAASERVTSPVGTAIQWERCLALETLANEKETPPEERMTLLEQAAGQARQLSWCRGYYSSRGAEMLKRVSPLLHEADKK